MPSKLYNKAIIGKLYGTVAQLVEHQTENLGVVGSTPTCPTN